MMHLGLNGLPRPEDRDLVRELGVTWVKLAWPLFKHRDLYRREAELCREQGLNVVVDLRIDLSDDTPLSWGQVYNRRMEALRQLEEAHPAQVLAAAEQAGESLLQHRVRLTHDEAMEVFCEEVSELVTANRDLVTDWEVQGEFMCPTVVFGSLVSFDYQFHLVRFAEAVHRTDPAARVWTGGNGIWVNSGWIESLLAHREDMDGARYPLGAGQTYDVCNWHHYGHTVEEQESPEITLEQQIAGYDKVFARVQDLQQEVGKGQPFASTEWGFPMYRDEKYSQLASNVYGGGIRSIHEDAAPEWYEASLACMQRWDFRVVCIHELREQDVAARSAYFWGGFCGLIDYEGRRRPAFDVVQKWAWAARDSGEAAF